MLLDILEPISAFPPVLLYLSLILLSATPFIEAHITVPLGIMLGLPFPICCLIGLSANFLSVMIAVKWTRNTKIGNDSSTRLGRAVVMGRRYGVPGLALMGPILGANHFSAVAAVLLGVSKRSIYIWQFLSISLWGIGTGLLFKYGISLFKEGGIFL
ncbi:hypothetical protein [Terribacillus saccharophilus]|uniref:Small multi-drug export protein n=1 Tax=Terribacillus saccharophilus TaxID=361277 RepID=A0ABX4GZB6_9BACI|nr:hypothetical protein [Terribacillus saccharophilus]PAD35653.1 hypothetical protein CHH56_08075 [Terribacillus saccharophilus]PAD96624.1 hypothetical protein CHH50_08485 [Terribacillus saccharophilus]PAE00200.1 hypothetical protein CHH48_09390 [Terribacillus saccharophilus]